MKPVLVHDNNGRALVLDIEDEGALLSQMKERGYIRAFINREPYGLKLENGKLVKFMAHPWIYRPDGLLLKTGIRVSWEKKIRNSLVPYSIPKSGIIVKVNDFNKSYDVEDDTGYVHCSVPANEVNTR